ncbi:hypothetical protein KKH30_02060, partial [Candidatus Micrarchaeota archaeon]|nr:hypothetical protein [Candidatus Micrarchaeota archaeon]
MVSRNVLIGAAVVVVVAVAVVMFMQPSEEASLQRLDAVLVKHGVSTDNMYEDLSGLSTDELESLKAELSSFDGSSLFPPAPVIVSDTQGLVLSLVDFTANYKLLQSRNDYISANFPLPCSEIEMYAERNRLEGELIASLEGLEDGLKHFDETYGDGSNSGGFWEVASLRVLLEGEYASHNTAYDNL